MRKSTMNGNGEWTPNAKRKKASEVPVEKVAPPTSVVEESEPGEPQPDEDKKKYGNKKKKVTDHQV